MRKILENGRLRIVLPIKLRTISARRRIIVPGVTSDGSEPLALAVARAFRWQHYLDEGKFKSVADLAAAIGIDVSCVARTLRLRMLSPKIVHRIVTGDMTAKMNLEQLRHGVPELWKEQEEMLMGEEADLTQE